MHPEIFRIGSFGLPSYGLMMAVAFLAGLWLLRRRAPTFGIPADTSVDVAVWILISSLVGSKILLVIVEWPHFVSSWAGFLSLLRSAGVFYGGLIGGLLGAFVLLRKRGIGFFAFTDAAAPVVALGQAFGRIGCFLAGCCWGRMCEKPWAVTFTDPLAHENVGVPLGIPLHPTQLYEALGTLILCGLLVAFEKRSYPGETLARYLGGYSILRFLIETFRGDPRGDLFGVVSTSQAIALSGVVLAVALAFWGRRRARAAAAT